MRLIKNALIYRASLPDAKALAMHLAEKPFTPVLESHQSSCGFIQHPTTKELVSQFPGGYAFRMRLDAKPISKRAIDLATWEKVQAQQEELGRDARPYRSIRKRSLWHCGWHTADQELNQ